MSIAVKFDVLNVKNSPSIGADTFAARPVSAATGAIYIATDTNVMYRWNGSIWATIGGGVSGSGTINKVPVWTGSGTLGDSDLIYTIPGSYPNKLFISGASFESQFAAPTTNGQAAGWIIRRTSDNNIIGMLYGQDTTLSGTGSSNIFHHYIQDNYFIKVYSGVSNFYHSFFKNGNVTFNGYTDNGYRVQVTGDMYVDNSFITRDGTILYGNTGVADIKLQIKTRYSISTYKGMSIGGPNTDISAFTGNPTIIGGVISLSGAIGDGGIYFGNNHTITSGAGSSINHILIGAGITMPNTGNTSNGNIIIGGSNNFNGYTNGQISNICLGAFNSTAGSSFYAVQLYGSGIKAYANNQLIFGYNSSNVDFGIREMYLGYGVRNENNSVNSNNGNGIEVSINPSGAYNGTDQTGGNLVLAAGKGTGAGVGGDVIFSTPSTTTSGTTLQTLTKRWYVKQTNGILSNQSSVNASALVDLYSTTQGLGVMSMTTTQKNAIASPRAGLMIFDNTLAKMCIYTGSAWQTITSV